MLLEYQSLSWRLHLDDICWHYLREFFFLHVAVKIEVPNKVGLGCCLDFHGSDYPNLGGGGRIWVGVWKSCGGVTARSERS